MEVHQRLLRKGEGILLDYNNIKRNPGLRPLAKLMLMLYSYLEQLGPRAFYADTDSVVYASRPGEWKPELGDYLGDLTYEVPDNRIIEFVTGGPKN